jgi:hypothetical protein
MLEINRRHIWICVMLFMEIWIQAVIEVYCSSFTYIDLSSVHLSYPSGFRLQFLAQFYWTGLCGHFLCACFQRNLPKLYKLSHITFLYVQYIQESTVMVKVKVSRFWQIYMFWTNLYVKKWFSVCNLSVCMDVCTSLASEQWGSFIHVQC